VPHKGIEEGGCPGSTSAVVGRERLVSDRWGTGRRRKKRVTHIAHIRRNPWKKQTRTTTGGRVRINCYPKKGVTGKRPILCVRLQV